jgi:hypothetical protein
MGSCAFEQLRSLWNSGPEHQARCGLTEFTKPHPLIDNPKT